MDGPTVDRRYEGEEKVARVAYQADATSMIQAGWQPVSQAYVSEGWGKGHLDVRYAFIGVAVPAPQATPSTDEAVVPRPSPWAGPPTTSQAARLGSRWGRSPLAGKLAVVLLGLVVLFVGGAYLAQPRTVVPLVPILPVNQPTVTLLDLSGNGIKNTQEFLASGTSITVAYTYNCSGVGGSGNFIVNLEDPSGLVDGIVNELGSGGTSSSAGYLSGDPGPFHLEIDSECSWHLTVTGRQ